MGRTTIMTVTLSLAGLASYYGLIKEHTVVEQVREEGFRTPSLEKDMAFSFSSASLAEGRKTYRVCTNPDIITLLNIPETCAFGDHYHFHRLPSKAPAMEWHTLGGGCGENYTTYLFQVGEGISNYDVEFVPPSSALGNAIQRDLSTLESRFGTINRPTTAPYDLLSPYKHKSLSDDQKHTYGKTLEVPLRPRGWCLD